VDFAPASLILTNYFLPIIQALCGFNASAVKLDKFRGVQLMINYCSNYWRKLPNQFKPIIATVGLILGISLVVILSYKLGFAFGYNI